MKTAFDLSQERDKQSAERGKYATAATATQVQSVCQSQFSQGWDAALRALSIALQEFTLDEDEFPLEEHIVDTDGILKFLRANRIICEPEDRG